MKIRISSINPFVSRPATPKPDGEDCTILFGHNTTIHKVLMQFSGGVDRLILSPEGARDVASKLQHFADLAEDSQDVAAAKHALKDQRRHAWYNVKKALKK